jgi:hypothetical protein
VGCGGPCRELHHPRDLRPGCGMSRKSPHDTVIPLCKFHHDEFHRLGKKPWEEKYAEQVDHAGKGDPEAVPVRTGDIRCVEENILECSVLAKHHRPLSLLGKFQASPLS